MATAPGTGRTYYYNTVTRQTQYEVPDEVLQEQQQQQQQGGASSPQVRLAVGYGELCELFSTGMWNYCGLKIPLISPFFRVLLQEQQEQQEQQQQQQEDEQASDHTSRTVYQCFMLHV